MDLFRGGCEFIQRVIRMTSQQGGERGLTTSLLISLPLFGFFLSVDLQSGIMVY